MYYEKPNYIKIDEIIEIIERAAGNGIIERKAAEIIIQDIYHETDINKYHRPK